MQQGRHVAPWLKQLAVVAGFGAAFSLLHLVSLAYWMPLMGLRVAFVLLLPRRYWAALVLSETLAQSPWAYACIPYFGLWGALIYLVPAMPVVMLAVWLLRRSLPIYETVRREGPFLTERHLVALVGCAAVVSIVASIDNTLLFSLTIPAGVDTWALIGEWAPRYLLGNYLGCLILAPLILAVHEFIRREGSWRAVVEAAGHSRMLLEGCLLGGACLAILTLLAASSQGQAWQQSVRMAMFLPVAWMAVRYGWQGAAAGGLAASIGILLTLPQNYEDPGVIQAQALIAFAITLLLPLGARVGALNEQEKRAQQDLLQSVKSAQREIFQTELRMQAAIQSMSKVVDGMHEAHGRLLHRASNRGMLFEDEEKRYRLQHISAKNSLYRVANSFHPAQWDVRGLPAALWDGPIAQVLYEINVPYRARVPDTANLLSQGVQLALYRLACEAVAYLLVGASVWPSIRLSIRKFGPRQAWAVLSVESVPEPHYEDVRALDAKIVALPRTIPLPPQSELLSSLGALGLNPELMADRARVYGGRVRFDKKKSRILVTVMDIDASTVRIGARA